METDPEQQALKNAMEWAGIQAGLGVLLSVIAVFVLQSGELSDTLKLSCERSGPAAPVDCVITRHFLNFERLHESVSNVVGAEERYHQPSRTSVVFLKTPQRDDIWTEALDETVVDDLNGFVADRTRKQYEFVEEGYPLVNSVWLGGGLLVGLIGLGRWLWLRRKLGSVA